MINEVKEETITTGAGVAVMTNPLASPASEAYGPPDQSPSRIDALNQAGFDAAENEIRKWPGSKRPPCMTYPAWHVN